MLNNIVLFASIVDKEIELRHSRSEIPVIEFRVIHKNSKVKNPLFIDIECWGSHAEHIVKDLTYGTRLIIHGSLRSDSWERDGIKRSKIKITADRIIIVGQKPEREQTQPDQNEDINAF